ncbi:frizzled-5 [Lepeophtheirus salmonis]|uniref:frizzled-5 n=1 Tax=Lepeophtheirus salmonis TaxID=72036 RepID=UPI001AE0EA9D|nr:frizzled-5-like [Lepeophtheirus salmonis]
MTSSFITLLLIQFMTYHVSTGLELHQEMYQCVPIKVDFCSGMRYNLTRMPNKFNHQTQEEAELEVIQFRPLVDIQCSPDIRFFLCGLYTPICLPNFPKPVPVCRSVCERVKRSCFPIMKQYGFDWPSKMECSLLPEGGDEICMDPWDVTSNEQGKGTSSTNPPPHVNENGCSCPNKMIIPGSKAFFAKVENCHSTCRSPYVEMSSAYSLEMILSTLSIVCMIASCMTSFTFVVDTQRFNYPSRPILYISYCYIMVALGFVLRLSVGHERTSCSKTEGEILFSKYGLDFNQESTTCLSVFILTYYFGTAANLWWIALTYSWFLSSGLKWAPEAISNISYWFHIISWTIPAVKTLIILILNAVDGDPISGICYVGSQNRYNLIGFVIFPSLIYIFISLYFLMRAIISLFKIHGSLPREQVGSFEKLLIRISIFSALYLWPTITVWSCWVYELWNADIWEDNIACEKSSLSMMKPNLYILFLKYAMMLMPGISSASWICSEKTIEISWQKIFMFPNVFKKKQTSNIIV